jgi:hypothetical protein
MIRAKLLRLFKSIFIPVSDVSPLDLGFLVEGNCLASPKQNSQDGKKT